MKFRDESEIPESGGQNFVKLKDKESIVGVFLGDPYEYSAIWSNKKSDVVPDGTPNSKFRFRVNFVTKDKSGYVAKIFEQGAGVYRRLIKLNEDFQGLEGVVVKISRKGSTMNDTEYTIDPVMDPKNPRQLMPVPPAALTVKMQDLKQHDSKKTGSAPAMDHDFGPPPEQEFEDHPEVPF